MTTLVCNTGPLIALAKIQKIDLLNELGLENILIPYRVQKELLGKIGEESCFIESALESFIQIRKRDKASDELEKRVSRLDAGEQEVILLGTTMTDDVLLLIDDKAGRRVAKQLGLSVVGTAGILLLFKQQGLVEKVMPLLTEIRQRGYWLSDVLMAQVQQKAGE
jgi:predicted nucleic acid-binding protein